jgi:hypothetical protein
MGIVLVCTYTNLQFLSAETPIIFHNQLGVDLSDTAQTNLFLPRPQLVICPGH